MARTVGTLLDDSSPTSALSPLTRPASLCAPPLTLTPPLPLVLPTSSTSSFFFLPVSFPLHRQPGDSLLLSSPLFSSLLFSSLLFSFFLLLPLLADLFPSSSSLLHRPSESHLLRAPSLYSKLDSPATTCVDVHFFFFFFLYLRVYMCTCVRGLFSHVCESMCVYLCYVYPPPALPTPLIHLRRSVSLRFFSGSLFSLRLSSPGSLLAARSPRGPLDNVMADDTVPHPLPPSTLRVLFSSLDVSPEHHLPRRRGTLIRKLDIRPRSFVRLAIFSLHTSSLVSNFLVRKVLYIFFSKRTSIAPATPK